MWGNTWMLHFMLGNRNVCSYPIIDLWLYTSHNNYIPIFSIYYANMERCTLIFHYIKFNMKNIFQHFLSCKT